MRSEGERLDREPARGGFDAQDASSPAMCFHGRAGIPRRLRVQDQVDSHLVGPLERPQLDVDVASGRPVGAGSSDDRER